MNFKDMKRIMDLNVNINNNFGYLFVKCITIMVTVLFQLILLFQIENNIIAYILSNISIISGYIIDMYSMKSYYYPKRRFINFCLIYSALSLALALSDIMFIVNYDQVLSKTTEPTIYKIVYSEIPIFSFVTMFFYLCLNISKLIDTEKEIYDNELHGRRDK